MRTPFVGFSIAILGFYLLLWGSQILIPGGTASTVILVLITVVGMVFVQPGWNLTPGRPAGYWAVLFGVLLGSAALAAYVLRLFQIPIPYDTATLNILTILPGVLTVTGIEELLFRQVMFRWLEKRQVSGRETVLATSVAFGGAHLGPLLSGGEVDGPFYLLQSLYMVWVGLLLGELRRASDSWAVSWAGHVIYNVTVLFFLALDDAP